jgi:uncharacterized protein HemY
MCRLRNLCRSIAAFALVLLCLGSTTASACRQCRPLVQAGIYSHDFSSNVFVIILPIVILVGIALAIYFADTLQELRTGARAWHINFDEAR